MRLVDLNPRWWAAAGRHGQGIRFDCPCCVAAGRPPVLVLVAFANPLDGGAPCAERSPHWSRQGETFDDLTISPSIDGSSTGHWHGWVTAGEIS